MVMLVTLQQASDHLRRDTTDDNNDLTLKIHAASNAVLNYLKDGADFLNSSGDVDVDSAGDLIGVPFEVQAAVLIMLGVLYTDRVGMEYIEGPANNQRLGNMAIPRTVQFLLDPLRTPTLE